jgi:hypothetical protein
VRGATVPPRGTSNECGLKEGIFMRARTIALNVILLLALATGFTVQAQKPNPKDEASTRSVQGVVLDESKQPVAGAAVQLKDAKTLQIRSFITQQDGKYHFTGLSTNVDYELRAEHAGRNSSMKRVDVFNTRPVVTVDLQLKK